MDSSHRPLSRAVQLAFGGVLIAFAWLLLSVVLGLGAGNAHADDADEGGGVLSSLTGGVADVAGGVVDTASNTVTTVVAPVAAPVVETVTTVVPPAAPVLEVVADTAAAVVEPVHELASSGVVSEVAAPVVDLVTAVPVVGGVVTTLGVDQAVTDVAGTVDDTAAGLTGVVTTAVPEIVTPGASTPGETPDGAGVLPGAGPAGTDAEAAALAPAAAVAPATVPNTSRNAALAGPDAAALLRALFLSSVASSGALDSVVASASGTSEVSDGWSVGGILSLLRSALPADSVFSGSGGAGPGAWVLAALGLVVAYRAWVQRNGLENDAAPAAPAFATDVSPD